MHFFFRLALAKKVYLPRMKLVTQWVLFPKYVWNWGEQNEASEKKTEKQKQLSFVGSITWPAFKLGTIHKHTLLRFFCNSIYFLTHSWRIYYSRTFIVSISQIVYFG